MTYWLEVRRWQRREGKPFFVELGNELSYQGFRSVYAYTDETRDKIAATKSSAGLEGTSVYSDMLFLDFDNVDPSDTIMHLYDEGYEFSVWNSGNRSVHLHVTIIPMEGPHVPYSQRMWSKTNAIGCDLSFYTHAGQFRLPSTVHEKTRKRKELIMHRGGRPLEIPNVERPALPGGGGTGSGNFMGHLLRNKAEGGRRIYVFRLAMLAYEEGLTLEVALAKILWWNSKCATPKLEEHEVVRKVHEAYRHGAKKTLK